MDKTIEQYAHDHLFNNGMFEEDVQKVIAAAKEDDLLKETMSNRWTDSMTDYPPPIFKRIYPVAQPGGGQIH